MLTTSSKYIISASLLLGSLVLSGCGSTSDGGVYKSIDAGENWEAKNFISQQGSSVSTISNLEVNALLMNPNDPENIYLGSKSNGLYVTFDGGEHWIVTGLKTGTVYGVALDQNATDTMYAAVNKTIQKSTDGGVTWETVYTDIKDSNITTIVVDSYDSSRVYAGTASGAVFKSEDRGLSWNLRLQLEDPIQELQIAKHDTRIIFALSSKYELFRTTTAGEPRDLVELPKNTNAANSGWDKLDVSKVYDITIDPNNSNVVYIVTDHSVEKSSDDGVSWSDVHTLLASDDPLNKSIRNIAVLPGNPSVLYFTINNSLYKSLDGGETWKALDNFPSSRSLNVLVANYNSPSTIYIGTIVPAKKGGLIKL